MTEFVFIGPQIAWIPRQGLVQREPRDQLATIYSTKPRYKLSTVTIVDFKFKCCDQFRWDSSLRAGKDAGNLSEKLLCQQLPMIY